MKIQRRPEQKVARKIVVVFDICSSSNILEGMKLNDSLAQYYNFLIRIKNFLLESSAGYRFETYKFLGDGWILLFAADAGAELRGFIPKLAEFVDETLKIKVLPSLESQPAVLGITCGVDSGFLRKIVMMGRVEFVGRPINIACRLQELVKHNVTRPQNQVLMSGAAYEMIFCKANAKQWLPKREKYTLRNINGGRDYKCVRLEIPFLEIELME